MLFHENSNIGPEPLMNSSAVSAQVRITTGDLNRCLGRHCIDRYGLILCMKAGLSGFHNWRRAVQAGQTHACQAALAAILT